MDARTHIRMHTHNQMERLIISPQHPLPLLTPNHNLVAAVYWKRGNHNPCSGNDLICHWNAFHTGRPSDKLTITICSSVLKSFLYSPFLPSVCKFLSSPSLLW